MTTGARCAVCPRLTLGRASRIQHPSVTRARPQRNGAAQGFIGRRSQPTVWETVLFGRTPYLGFLGQPSKKDEEIARQSLARVSALPFADRRVGELSGGEQQRILLARALCQSTPILLLDEPTAHLDLQYQVSLLEVVHDLAHKDNLAVLIALHDLNLAAHYADRIALMVAGQIKAEGQPQQVLRRELIEEAYCLPVQVVNHPFLDIPLVLPDKKDQRKTPDH